MYQQVHLGINTEHELWNIHQQPKILIHQTTGYFYHFASVCFRWSHAGRRCTRAWITLWALFEGWDAWPFNFSFQSHLLHLIISQLRCLRRWNFSKQMKQVKGPPSSPNLKVGNCLKIRYSKYAFHCWKVDISQCLLRFFVHSLSEQVSTCVYRHVDIHVPTSVHSDSLYVASPC